MCLPGELLVVVGSLQLQSEGSYVILVVQQKDPPALVQARGLTDPHASGTVALI